MGYILEYKRIPDLWGSDESIIKNKSTGRKSFIIYIMTTDHVERDDLFAFKYGDFDLVNYQSHPRIKAPIAV